ncbi:MAG: LpxL/LpxP family Kdo(2)-lipid IV(A) lauroyl/palmitoleoyl acyltransferase [Methylococcales bacterium]|jgi:Kdo2-lipid IVA lauroyltransferase/acyltransferase|nr:LpxL/LpxP family Kdo(2)-lipid IV(A) lauroyl/palmitoleoyl acyltransferase [Methylococcales bacterium]MBT7409721.1 LpxL/LpxP family Kdo(2)-lipid IV(A) lauroyl/palmitoleoyl acyltransferase [Methylococcales bacterium]
MIQHQPFTLSMLHPRYWLTWLGLAILRITIILPYPMLCKLGRMVGRLLFKIPSKRKHVVITNLKIAFPDWNIDKVNEIALKNFEATGINIFDTFLSWWGSKKTLFPLMEIEGLEHLDKALENGRGAILLGAHFTTLEIAGRFMTFHRPAKALYRHQNNEVVNRMMVNGRLKYLDELIHRNDIRKMVKSLKKNGIIWFPPDQAYSGKQSVLVNFFGRDVSCTTSTSRLAKLTKTKIIPFFTERKEDDSGYILRLHPALEDFPSKDITEDTQRLFNIFEQEIRQRPTQYLWLHKRFKPYFDGMHDVYKQGIK